MIANNTGTNKYVFTGTSRRRLVSETLKQLRWLACVFVAAMFLCLSLSHTGWAQGDELTELRQQLDVQQEMILKQGQLLEQQRFANELQLREINQLRKRLDRIDAKPAGVTTATVPTVSLDSPQAMVPKDPENKTENGGNAFERGRDSIGDLNAASVKEGLFPGSFRIPGPGNVSLAIGGFIKTVVIEDTNAEDMGAFFLPAFLGTRRNDKRGDFAIDSTTTRLNLDVRAPVRNGNVRGYLETDLNNNNDGSLDLQIRHAYGTWKSNWGTLTAGQTWSTLMDLQILPEGLTEPTLSGAIFQRQALLRWSQDIDKQLKFDLAIEDPNSNDVFNNQGAFAHSSVPDVVLAGEYNSPDVGHIRLGGIYRRIEINRDDGGSSVENGWGVSGGAYLNTVGRDRVILSGSYGKGLGRYLLGITPTSGGVVDPVNGNLKLRTNYGGLVAYQRYWNKSLRSNFAIGHARAKTFSRQPGSAFSNSTYAYGNLMWSILPYLTVGIEYDYGRRENKNNSDKDNHRIILGTQVF